MGDNLIQFPQLVGLWHWVSHINGPLEKQHSTSAKKGDLFYGVPFLCCTVPCVDDNKQNLHCPNLALWGSTTCTVYMVEKRSARILVYIYIYIYLITLEFLRFSHLVWHPQ